MRWLRQLFTRRKIYSDLSEEIRLHLSEKVEALMAGGMTRKDAEYAAKREFGNVTRIEESGHEPWMWPRAESILADIRFAFRKLRHSPGFALTAILTLAVGIGANVVTFSVLNGILLRPLDVPHPENLLQIGTYESWPDYRDYQDRNQSFSGMLAYKVLSVGIGIDKSVSSSWGNAASGNYFDVLGLQPALGRFFHASDEHGRGSAPYIVLSYDFWQRRFAANPHILGKVVTLNQHPFSVIGVAPQNFHGTDYFFWPDYWIPAVNAEQVTGWDDFDWRRHRGFTLLGRLKPGVAQQQATANMDAIARRMAKQYPDDEGLTLTVHEPGLAGNSNDPTKKVILGMTLLAVLVSLLGGIVGTFFARLLLGALAHWRAGD
ncbi:MAG: ABC transporter permease, partial [Acidobacteriaceae bacterium]